MKLQRPVHRTLKSKVESVPELPGVYLFKDRDGNVIYVGKAKSLKRRLLNHLSATNPSDKSYKIVSSSCDFDYIVVKSEREALKLEAELIKTYLPRFNVLLKDDKSYPFLVITDEEFPTVKIVRKKDDVSGEKFGPFIPPKIARQLKELLHKTFKLRKCKELKKRNKPCLQYYIERCTAPCCGYVGKKEYRNQVKGALSFLKGNVKELIKELHSKIEEAAEKLEFERAASLRDQLLAIKEVYQRSSYLFDEFPNCDIFYLEEKKGLFNGVKLTVRNGIIYGKESFTFDPVDPWDEELLEELFNYGEEKISSEVVGTIWLKNNYSCFELPDRIFTNFKSLDSRYKTEDIPESILTLVKKNRKFERARLNLEKLREEYESVFYDFFPNRVEVFDISTLQGEATVGSCVVWENGEFVKSDYRRYRVRSVDGVNDYASMEEVLNRRFKRIKSGEVRAPDLVLVDGGVGQLNVAVRVRDSLNLDFRVFSIAKKEELVFTDDGEIIETKKYPLLFRFFTSLRDEAHRFAISYNRKVREREMLRSSFDGIKGLGVKRKTLIERFYPDLRELSMATIEELRRIGIPKNVAEEVIKRAREVFGGRDES
ncbi:Excinuclease ABC subunit C [Balnearium lithotrophicum]|uniref:UvrABC system protein C n=1 Tax=Balnearium lithotrophicum TaxID=223788 RepID=A0A521APP0_9BACT|nr:Excinuclease ABC subunit C [Balnearium lithotrophicum]